MRNRIPPGAFEYYASLGIDRSYAKVATRYGVTKRAILRCAKREDWQRRVDELDVKARDASEKRAVESIEQMNDRHLRAMKIIQAKALEALKSLSLETAFEAIRALDMATKSERLIRGEPSGRTEISLEETLKREYERWLVVPANVTATTAIAVKEVTAHDARRDGDQRNTAGQRLLTHNEAAPPPEQGRPIP